MRRSAATALVEYLQRRSPALHKAVLSSLFFKQPSRVKPLLTFGSGAGSMSHCADWLPLAANAGLSWVSAAVWGGVSECSKKDTEKIENRFLSSFGLFAWVFFFRGALQHQIQSVGGEDTDSRWFVGTWSLVFCDLFMSTFCAFSCVPVASALFAAAWLLHYLEDAHTCSVCTLKCKYACFALLGFLLLCFTI